MVNKLINVDFKKKLKLALRFNLLRRKKKSNHSEEKISKINKHYTCYK